MMISIDDIYLKSTLPNSRTGVHTVADVFCLGCNERLGWYYLKASDHSQKYKEGDFHYETDSNDLH